MPIVGVDVSKKKLDSALLIDPERVKVRTKVVANNASGFEQLLAFACRHGRCAPEDLHFVMEATGVYHEAAALALHRAGACVTVANPAQVRDFAKGLAVRTKTDAKDSVVLARYGHLAKPKAWVPPPEAVLTLKSLIRRIEAIETDIRREKNRLEKAEVANAPAPVRDSLEKSLAFLEAQKAELERLIDDHIDRHPELKEDQAQFLLRFVLKCAYVTNLETAPDLAEYTKLPGAVVHDILEQAKDKRLVEVLGLSDMRSNAYRYALTGTGRDWAIEALGQSQYTGPAPVTMEAFRAQVAAQSIAADQVTPESMARALSHLVLPEGTIARLGPAANSARALLLYGEPGNGKTSIAMALGKAFDHAIYLPHCIVADGQIIRFYDPSVHEAWTGAPPASAAGVEPDERWVLCRRPVVVTGGELNIEMLDLSFDPISKFYEAPAHMKATGGLFIADDLGRQRVQALDLINRWILPLERRIDFLTLHTGKKIELPFDQLVVFSTNSPPQELIDAAGMRRIPYKFHVSMPTHADYVQILRDVCAAQRLEVPEEVIAYLLDEFYPKTGIAMSAVHPRFIVDHVVERCRFEGIQPHLSLELVHDAVENLVVEGEPPPVPTAHAAF